MRVISAKVNNFASYKELDFNFTAKGLTLVAGATGSGKSTLCDLVPWCLYGHTSKNGAVDEVRAWTTQAPTTATVTVHTSAGEIEVTRTRGKVNDLSFKKDGVVIRGKDLSDTQKKLNRALGVDLETYLAGAYFHEFSSTAQFFLAPAKTRRQVIEQLVDLSFAVGVNKKAVEYRKLVKVARDDVQKQLIREQANHSTLALQIKTNTARHQQWVAKHKASIEQTSRLNKNFEADTNSYKAAQLKKIKLEADRLQTEVERMFSQEKPKAPLLAKIEALKATMANLGDQKCPTCGNAHNSDKRLIMTSELYAFSRELKELEQAEIRLVDIANELEYLEKQEIELNAAPAQQNPYETQLKQLEKEINPYQQVLDQLSQDHVAAGLVIDQHQEEMDDLQVELSDVETLTSLIDTLRATTVKNTVQDLQNRTNKVLAKYFNAEIKVVFEMSEADKIEVTIYKDGNSCSFSQLSKGQRQMLKLSFGMAVMAVVGNKTSGGFSAVFFDEALEGLDENLKIKAYALLESLTEKHESVFVVEHSEALKALFHNRIDVALIDGHSQLET